MAMVSYFPIHQNTSDSSNLVSNIIMEDKFSKNSSMKENLKEGDVKVMELDILLVLQNRACLMMSLSKEILCTLMVELKKKEKVEEESIRPSDNKVKISIKHSAHSTLTNISNSQNCPMTGSKVMSSKTEKSKLGAVKLTTIDHLPIVDTVIVHIATSSCNN